MVSLKVVRVKVRVRVRVRSNQLLKVRVKLA